MSRKDKRPESQKEQSEAGLEVSQKATNPGAFDDETGEGQTRGSEERGPKAGQYTDMGSPGYQGR